MIVYILIAIVLLAILYISYNRIKYKPGEHRSGLTLFIPGIIAILVLVSEVTINHPKDVKLVNHVAETIRCYEPWKESVEGKRVVHPTRHTLICNNGDEIPISRNTYQYFYNLWNKEENNTTRIKIDEYNVIETEWPGDPSTSLTISNPVPYYNYMMNVYSLYDIYDVNISKAIKSGLIVRPGIGTVNSNNVLEPRQNLILGMNVSDSIQRKLNYIASLDQMFRPILLVWPNEDENKISQQRSLWTGGKENEAVFCIGLGEGNKILWSGSFSWDDTRRLENFILKEVLNPGDTLDLDKYVSYLESGYKNNYWKSIKLESYQFLKLPLNQLLVVIIMSTVILINIIIVIKLLFLHNKK